MNFYYPQLSSSSSSPNIAISHNSRFTFDDIESILEPLFGHFYGRSQLRTLMSSANHVWAAYDKTANRFIACALLEYNDNDKTLYLKLFGVDESSQGQGVGTRLLKAVRTWARKERYFAITLHASIDNYKAIGLYEKVGFRKQFYLRDFYSRGSFSLLFQQDQPDAYQMILYLQ